MFVAPPPPHRPPRQKVEILAGTQTSKVTRPRKKNVLSTNRPHVLTRPLAGVDSGAQDDAHASTDGNSRPVQCRHLETLCQSTSYLEQRD